MILFFNPTTGTIITAFTAGNNFPCSAALVTGAPAATAIECLERSGFVLEAFNFFDGGIVYEFRRIRGG